MLSDFLKTKRPKEDLKTALDILNEFKSNESKEEWAGSSFESWSVFERFQKYLEELTKSNIGEKCIE